mmetsp:Transcript_8228/g.17540  ORF Transcript_8228/g.17540 Transcript_8228/m.17540 type:complete len:426 (+) Transcript_8228:32-1309(+)
MMRLPFFSVYQPRCRRFTCKILFGLFILTEIIFLVSISSRFEPYLAVLDNMPSTRWTNPTTRRDGDGWQHNRITEPSLASLMTELNRKITNRSPPKKYRLSGIPPRIANEISTTRKNFDGNPNQPSPACHPHFNLALPNGKWDQNTKFKKIYFYHARKAGGSTMNKYLHKVARHYGIEILTVEWDGMEEPGTNDVDTFYVSHLREPVARSISHFKYQGRWNCPDLILKPGNFTPTRENANPIETWNQTGGHVPLSCRWYQHINSHRFRIMECAVNCYSQWFSGLACPTWNISAMEQYAVAKARVLRFNMIVVIEKLRDPNYVQAVERFFGVPGLTEKGIPYCERASKLANTKFPFVVRNETRESLTRLNEIDIQLYHELSDCLNEEGSYNNFPEWDGNRFALNSFNKTEKKRAVWNNSRTHESEQ